MVGTNPTPVLPIRKQFTRRGGHSAIRNPTTGFQPVSVCHQL